MIKVGSDFSGVGAFNQALMRLGIQYEEVFACDMDKYARQTFIHNYGEPKYYPTNVYDRDIPSDPLDIYMTSPPCQAFSLAGKRLGKDDKRGILFFNSLEFIQINKPRFFIFENVKGLLSDDGGKTFSEWVNLLGGKSINGAPVLFPYEDSVPYHLYWKVLNAKNYGVPQNRERVFLIGIRDDEDNKFNWPVEEILTKRLKDVLEEEVFEKYYLSEKMVDVLKHHKNPIIENETPKNSATIHAGYFKMGGRDQQYIKSNLEKYYLSEKMIEYLETRSDNFNNGKINYRTEDDYALTITKSSSSLDISDNILKIKSATSKGYEEATDGDSINFNVPNSKTRRGRVGKGLAQTLDTGCQQGVLNDYKIRRLTPRECFRLMDFPDTFTWPVSDSQAYKQAGNSIVVAVLAKIINNLNIK